MRISTANIIRGIRSSARPLEGAHDGHAAPAYDPLIDAIGDRRFALIGEASHGTHEFYATRAAITRRLIAERGFNAVVVEADWPDAYRVNRYVRGFNDDSSADGALSGFRRFPQWMWRNTVVEEFVDWLRAYNAAASAPRAQVGLYGMDLYSLRASIAAVLRYLDNVDHAAATRARYRYSCFEDFGEDPQAYGYAARFDLERSCEEAVVQQLVELQRRSAEYARRDGRAAEDEYFHAEQNARLVKNAEQYYRSMFQGRVSSWNLRDTHMVQTIGELVRFLDRMNGAPTKLVIWAHNSHLGDASATEVGQAGELNVGQLMRETYGQEQTFLTGFTTHDGTVTAATDWDGPAETKTVRPSLDGSYEQLFHETQLPRFLLILSGGGADRSMIEPLRASRLERAIGVIYRPQTERVSHYFHAILPEQFDAIIHLDRTRAITPLEAVATVVDRELEETYPTGV
ncbi:MAG TPA: erythromycin esterase family protein [Tepidisphaeraceae bacterium]|nr:erythromycin esterase family protein [Tepidisphaeraceae bacterium]